MPTDLGARFDSTYTGKPAHISPEDLLIFDRWWPTVREHITEVYFDVGLGPGRPSPAGTPANYAKMWLRLNQKRADILAVVRDEVWIIELRFAANTNALGRLLGYKGAYLEDPKLGANVRLMLVTNEYDADVERAALYAGIIYTLA